MDYFMLKLATKVNWVMSQAKKLFVNLTDDPYFGDYLKKGSGPTWYLYLFGSVFIYKATLSAYLLSQQDALSAGENIALFNTVWMDGLDRTVNLAMLLFCLHGAFLLCFSSNDGKIRLFTDNILATGHLNQIEFFQFKNSANKSTTQQKTHAKLNRFAASLRIPIRTVCTLLNAHTIYLEMYILFQMKQLDFTNLTTFLKILSSQLNFIVFTLISNGFVRLATRYIFLTLICIKTVIFKQRIPATYFRNVPDTHLKAETVEAYFVSIQQLLLPLKHASAFLGVSLFVSLAANLPSNALCITMTFTLPMGPLTRLLIISLATFQLVAYGGTIYLAASVNGAVHRPSMALLSAHIRNQRKNAENSFQTRLFRCQQGNVKDRRIRFLLHAERHFEQFILSCKRRYNNQYGLAFGTLGCITLLSASKALFIYVKLLSFYLKLFLNP